MTSARFVIGVDNGTGGCKVTVLRNDGAIVAESFHSYLSHYDEPRWVEQDPEDWTDAAFAGVRQATASLTDDERARIDGIAFSGPHHTGVLLDEHKRPIRRAILWNDQRADVESRELIEQHGELIHSVAHNTPAPTWTLSQFLWLSKHKPEEYARTRHVLFMKDYVRWRFSGEMGTDPIEAGGTLFFDIGRGEWSKQLLDLIGLSPAVLPRIFRPTDVVGTLTAEASERTGLLEGVRVITGTADTAAEVYGAGAVEVGDAVVKLATAGNYTVIAEHVGDPSVISYGHPVEGLFYLNSATNFAAASFRWFRETFFPELAETLSSDELYTRINAEIAAVPAGSDGLVFHPFLNGERSPYWDSRLRSSFIGLTSRHTRAHLARAVMEGVCFSIRDAGLVYGDVAPSVGATVRLIGGGSKSDVWTQIAADVLGMTVEVPASSEASFGTCLLAATASGWYSGLKDAVASTQRVTKSASPDAHRAARYDELFGIYRDAVTALTDVTHRLTRFQDESVGKALS
ncbi:xylulokinase [Cryobacterium sp. Y62]|uniref:xylulokinase n=1 Tax=Cryobacterium sp. Y62 TaxID=2048284 RepID=UPI000CE3CA6A|nr:xylulokinase [Cryobacterium sp. Y62]